MNDAMRSLWGTSVVLGTAALALALAACGGGGDVKLTQGALQAVAAAPAVGASGVVVADAPLARPTTTPCVITLFTDVAFNDFNQRPFSYPGSAACPGTPAKVVLEADYSVNAGRQFDRTALIAVGGVNLYFGTTQEPSATVAPSWRIERDVTEYAAALLASATGHATLENPVDATYTGVLKGTARLLFYPAASKADEAGPRIADAVYSLAGDQTTGYPASLVDSTQTLQRSLTLPTNVIRAYLDVYAQSQGGDEFWWTCVPDALTGPLQSCGGGAAREVWVRLDGQAAGVAPVYPWIFTGGLDPGLWRPTPGVNALNFIAYRVDLTPFASVLSDGKPHTVSIAVQGANNRFAVTANLLVYRDAGAASVTGAVTQNSLATQVPGGETTTDNIVVDGSGNGNGTLGVVLNRSLVITGYVDTSKGRVTTRVEQTLAFSNQQTFKIGDAGYSQVIDQFSTVDSKVSTDSASGTTVDTQALRYPLFVDYAFDNTANTQVSTARQSLQNALVRQANGSPTFNSIYSNAIDVTSQLQFNSSGGAQRLGEKGSQAVRFTDSLGSCYDRRITTADNLLATAADGNGCAAGNALNWLSQPDGAPPQGVLAQLGL